MRNLKKALSMALALVMMLGMLTVASAAEGDAAKLADFDSVENKEAVSLLVDLGIIAGITEGSVTNYKPEEAIDRNSFAKLVYFILMGDESADNFKGTGSLKDVAGTWAEGYVNYLNSVKILAGDEMGNFNGTNNVSVAQAAKMLLVALGYNAEDRGYENDVNWSTNIMKDAQIKGIMNNVTQTASQSVTRDNAALMVYNTLFATTVTPRYDRDMGEKYVSEYVANPTTLGLEVYGVVKATLDIGDVDTGAMSWSLAPAANTTPNFTSAIGKAINDKFSFGPDTVGGNAVIYVKVTYGVSDNKIASYTYKSIISSTALVGESNILSTTYGTRTVNQLMGLKGNSAGDGKHTAYVAAPQTTDTGALNVKVYINGKPASGLTGTADTALAIGGLGVPSASAFLRGDIVELIGNDDGEVAVIRITRKSVTTLGAAIETRVSGGKNQVRITSTSGLNTSWTAAEDYVGLDGLAKGDVVLYVKIGDVTYVEKAEKIEGEISTKTSDGNVTVNGTTYPASKLPGAEYADEVHSSSDMSAGLQYDVTYWLYLDNSKAIVIQDPQTDTGTSNYALVLETAWVSGSGIGSSQYAQAKLLFTDGTTDIVTVSASSVGTVNEANWGKLSDNRTVSNALCGNWVNFSVSSSSGKYTLNTLEGDNALKGDDVAFAKGETILALGSDKATVNANTVFIRETENSSGTKVYTVYTGNGNMPSFEGADVAVAVKSSFAAFVFVSNAVTTGNAGQLVYFEDDGYSIDADNRYVFTDVYVNGVAIEGGLKFASKPAVIAGGMYEVKSIVDGIYTVDSTNVFGDKGGNLATITAVGGGVVTIGTSGGDNATAGSYSFGSATQVFVIDSDYVLSEGGTSDIRTTTSGDMKAYIVLNDSGNYVSRIYLVDQAYDLT